MGPESEGVDLAGVIDLTSRFEVGSGVAGGHAPGSQEDHPGGLELMRFGVVKDHPGVVARGRDGVDVGVVDLQDQVLDLGVLAHAEGRVGRQGQLGGVHGPCVNNLVARPTRLVECHTFLGLGHFSAVPGRIIRARLFTSINLSKVDVSHRKTTLFLGKRRSTYQHMVGCVFGSVRREPRDVVGLGVGQSDRCADIGLLICGVDPGHEEGEVLVPLGPSYQKG